MQHAFLSGTAMTAHRMRARTNNDRIQWLHPLSSPVYSSQTHLFSWYLTDTLLPTPFHLRPTHSFLDDDVGFECATAQEGEEHLVGVSVKDLPFYPHIITPTITHSADGLTEKTCTQPFVQSHSAFQFRGSQTVGRDTKTP